MQDEEYSTLEAFALEMSGMHNLDITIEDGELVFESGGRPARSSLS